MSGRVFINYRRSDSQAAAGRLYDRLAQNFARDTVFMDVDGIEPGVDFVSAINRQVADCGAFLAVIGPGWVDARDTAGRRRLEDQRDNVRVEIEAALKRDIRVIPVLVDGARMPQTEELPESIRPLARRNAVEITHHRFGGDVDGLARVIQRAAGIELIKSSARTGSQDQSDSTWAAFFFSFEGRVSRKQFFWGMLLVQLLQLIFIYTIGGILLWGLYRGGINVGDALSQMLKSGKVPEPIIWASFVLYLPFLWPELALQMKRLHDFGQGWGLFAPLLLFNIGYSVYYLLEHDRGVDYGLVALFCIFLMMALIKGPRGPNEYGPDPLAKKVTALEA